MKLAVLVIGNGRDYIHQVIPSITANVLHPITSRLMVDDSGKSLWAEELDRLYPDYTISHGGPSGMAGAVQRGFDLCLAHDPDYVLWIEDDMLLTHQLPITEAARVLDDHPMVAQMCFRREPWAPQEFPCQLSAIVAQAPNWSTHHDTWTSQDFLFSMNPCLIPARILKLGWPSGPIGVGNEAGMTSKLLDQGYIFGSWGVPGDHQTWARHIGETRSETYAL